MQANELPFLPVLMDHIPHGICVVDENYSLAFWNKIMEEWTGLPRDEVLGKCLVEIYPNLMENRYKKRMDLVLQGGPPAFFSPQLHPYFLPLPLPNGSNRILQTVISAIPTQQPKHFLLLITITDMSVPVGQLKEISRLREQALSEVERRKESEQRHLLHIQRTPLGVIEFNADFKVTQWNPAAEKIFGYTEKEALGRSASELILSEVDKIHAKRFWEGIISKQNGFHSTRENVTKTGDVKVCEWYYTPLVGNDGKVIGVASLVQDISRRKKIEYELQESKKLEALGILAGGISHDFNNLLAIILGNLAMIRDKCTHSPQMCSKWLGKAEKASLQASELVKKLITFSDRGPQTRQELNLATVLENAKSITPMESNIKYTVSLPDDLKRLFGDEMQLVQVFYNILLNAGDAMPEGGEVLISARNLVLNAKNDFALKAGQYVLVTVGDEGVGIPKKFIDKIFDPYFTTKTTMTQKGIGLGLSSSYTIIQTHEGHIRVESTAGKGTTVYIYLPAFIDI